MTLFCSAEDIRITMASLGDELSEEDVADMVREADQDGDERIDLEGEYTRAN